MKDPTIYRSKEEVEEWLAKDPILRLSKHILDNDVATEKELKDIEARIVEEVEEAVRFAEESPYPKRRGSGRGCLYRYSRGGKGKMRNMTYAEALREAILNEMRRDPAVFLLGEDIGRFGGTFGVTRGLIDEFGEDRVRDTLFQKQQLQVFR